MAKMKPSFLLLIFLFLIEAFTIIACSGLKIQKLQSAGVYHRVKKNETALIIASAYKINLQKLAQTNNAINLNTIKEGDVLFIPEATRTIDNINTNLKTADNTTSVDVRKNTPKHSIDTNKIQNIRKNLEHTKETPITVYNKYSSPECKSSAKKQSKIIDLTKSALPNTSSLENITSKETVESKSKLKKSNEMKTTINKFIWPVEGIVKSRFGLQPNKTYNNWIKIVSDSGTKVKAAATGTVIFSSDLKNYGETIIIRHKNNFATVYTHLRKRYVRIDQNVQKGEKIALLAEKDEDGNAYINFEIRHKGKALDPLSFLP